VSQNPFIDVEVYEDGEDEYEEGGGFERVPNEGEVLIAGGGECIS